MSECERRKIQMIIKATQQIAQNVYSIDARMLSFNEWLCGYRTRDMIFVDIDGSQYPHYAVSFCEINNKNK